jgi:hypothetical protein
VFRCLMESRLRSQKGKKNVCDLIRRRDGCKAVVAIADHGSHEGPSQIVLWTSLGSRLLITRTTLVFLVDDRSFLRASASFQAVLF